MRGKYNENQTSKYRTKLVTSQNDNLYWINQKNETPVNIEELESS